MAKIFEKPPFKLTPADRLAFEGEAYDDIDYWAQIYDIGSIFPWQRYFYHHPAKDKMGIAGIRVGKSALIGRGFLHKGMYHPHSRFLNTSISSEQAKIVYHTCMELLSMPKLQHWVEHTERSPYPLIRLANGSEFWFRSVGYEAELLRGFQFDLISVDECAYITSDHTINTLKGRLLGVNPITREHLMGIFWQLSSPKGKRGWQWNRWKKGDPRFEEAQPDQYLSLNIRTTDNPLLSQDMIRALMAEYTEREIRQELFGEFLDAQDSEFDIEQLMYGCDDHLPEVRELNERIARWNERHTGKKSLKSELGISEDIEHYELDAEPGHQYIASWDLGKKPTKTGRNATVGMVWDVTALPWKLVAYRYEPGLSYLQALGLIEAWHERYSLPGHRCRTVIDATGKGDVLNEIIEAEQRIQVEGIVYSNALKPNLLTAGKIAIDRGLCRYPVIRRFLDQMSQYVQVDKDLAQDLVMSFCQAMYVARELTGVSMARPSVRGLVVNRRSPVAMTPHLRRLALRRMAPRTGREYGR